MKFILEGVNAKVFAKAIQSLAKIGSNLFIDAEENQLTIRAMNSNKSAFGSFTFYNDFFNELCAGTSSNNELENSCKVSMKACLGIFRNMKQVELCTILIDTESSKLNVQLKCRLETMKNHMISIVDDETLSPAFTSEDVPNLIVGSHKIFNEISGTFQASEEEITLEAGVDKLNVKNYVEGSRVNEKFMRSQLKLNANEFIEYKIGQETSVTFCLREFRAFLLFAECINSDMLARFEEDGSPIAFIIRNLNLFEAKLVMSTLAPDDVSMYELNSSKNAINQSIAVSLSNNSFKRSADNDNSQNTKKSKKSSTEAISFESIEQIRHNSKRNSKNISKTNIISKSLGINVSTDKSNISDITKINNAEQTEPFYPINTDSNNECFTFKDTEDVENIEYVPPSPSAENKRKNIRSVFSRCFEATFVPKEPTQNSDIFVPDSDTED